MPHRPAGRDWDRLDRTALESPPAPLLWPPTAEAPPGPPDATPTPAGAAPAGPHGPAGWARPVAAPAAVPSAPAPAAAPAAGAAPCGPAQGSAAHASPARAGSRAAASARPGRARPARARRRASAQRRLGTSSLLDAVVLVVGVAASLAAGWVVRLQDETRLRLGFEREATAALQTAQRELERSAHVLAGYANHLAALPAGERGAPAYVRAELARNPAVEGLSWSVLVRAHEREAYEAAQRACQPAFRITERDARGRLVTAGERDTYVVLAAVEPGQGYDPVLGFDIASDPVRADAVRMALLGQGAVAAAGLTRLPEMGGVPGVLLTHAVRDPAGGHELGVASAVLDVDDLLERCVPPEATGLQVMLDDLGGPAPLRLFPAGKASTPPDGLCREVPLRVAGRPWRLHAWLPGAVLQDRASHQHWAWVTAGLMTTWLAVRALRSERASRSLLANMLPVHVARQLAEGRRHVSDRHAAVSVLFADIVGFSELSARLPAEQLVGLLNDLFSDFDHVVEQHGMEKIKVIGDSYMAVSGLDGRGDSAYRAVRAGQAMLQAAARMGLQMRVGVHYGPVVAGVLGRTRFTYDLWGETVNVAARMEAHGVPGRVTVSDQARARISARILCDRRGPMVMKGIGLRESWIVRETPPAAS